MSIKARPSIDSLSATQLVRGDRQGASIRAQLRVIYPTMSSFNAAVAAYGSQSSLAEAHGTGRSTMYMHRKWLENGAGNVERKKKHELPLNSVMDKRVREFVDAEFATKVARFADGSRRYTTVTVYKLTDEYKFGQINTDGLVYLRTETSRSSLPSSMGAHKEFV